MGIKMFFPVMHISRDLYNKNYNDINNKERIEGEYIKLTFEIANNK